MYSLFVCLSAVCVCRAGNTSGEMERLGLRRPANLIETLCARYLLYMSSVA